MTPENKTQAAILEWLSLQYPEVRKHVIKIDNEGSHTPAGNMIRRRCGLHRGASDLFIAWPTLSHYGLWLEIKPDGWTKPRNKKEAERVLLQKEFLYKMMEKGYDAAFVCGFDEGINAIKTYLNANQTD